MYVYDGAGKESIEKVIETEVAEAQLNARLTDNELKFSPIPLGATVYDTRFNKEIVYEQGEKQLSDRDMFEVAKNPHLISSLTVPPRRRVYAPLHVIAVMILAPLLVVLILVRYRSKLRRP